MKEISNCETSISVTSSDRVVSSTSCKGNQIKWCKNDMWIKADDLGYEGLSEVIASRILKNSNIKDYVTYSSVLIKEYDTGNTYRGCMSKNFLQPGENLVTLYRLFSAHNINLDFALLNMSTEEKIKFVIEKVTEFTNIKTFKSWLGLLLEFDNLILNEDRHFHNIAVIKTENSFRLMPVFDNGAGFLSDTSRDYKMGGSVFNYIRNVSAKPFNTKFSRQTKAAEKICDTKLIINKVPDFYSCKLYTAEECKRVDDVMHVMIKRLSEKS